MDFYSSEELIGNSEENFNPASRYGSPNGSFLYFGFRSLFGLITWLGFTVPTRSRAIARTSFSALKRFGFFAIAAVAYRPGAPTRGPTSDSVTRAASWSNVTTS
jgi:hypothetical protein